MPEGFNLNPDTFSDKDLLGFDPYIQTLSRMIRDPDFKTPFCIGIYGRWGSGKTSFMRQLSGALQKDGQAPHIIPVWFNPWRYTEEEHLIIPFLKTTQQAINKYITSHKTIEEKLLGSLKTAAARMGKVAAAFAYCAQLDFKFLKFDFSKAVEREEELDKRKKEEDLSSIYYDTVTQLKEVVKEKPFRLTVFIDDLDRCLPEKAVKLLEAIKLFLDMEGYLFIIGVDKKVVEQGISHYYQFYEQTVTAEEYLEKMIQLPLELPPIEPGKKREFIESLLGSEYKAHADLIEVGVGDNPRALKRFVNLLAFMSRHADTVKENVKQNDPGHKDKIEKYFNPILYVKWSLIVFKFHQVHSDIKGNWHRLIELQEAAGTGSETSKIDIEEGLKKVLQKGEKEKEEDFFPDDQWLVSRFIHLTEAARITVSKSESKAGYRQNFQIGDMVLIPKGGFLYGDDKEKKEIGYDYEIDVFPVTNQQYKGYKRDWTFDEGKDNHPVVEVSGNDANEYCKWLTKTRNDGYEYRLPNEEEWEKASRGTDGRTYPWGEEFDKDKCNTGESGIKGTTEVTQYPEDAGGPYGCREMAGNVWEWTDSWHDSSNTTRVLRGGSWFNDQAFARCACRGWFNPDGRINAVGFRCARTLK